MNRFTSTLIQRIDENRELLEAKITLEHEELLRLRSDALAYGEVTDPGSAIAEIAELVNKAMGTDAFVCTTIPPQYPEKHFENARFIRNLAFSDAILSVGPMLDKLPACWLAVVPSLISCLKALAQYDDAKLSCEVEKKIYERAAHYLPHDATIHIPPMRRANLLPVLAHEYAHHVIHVEAKKGKGYLYQESLQEGICRVIEHHIANTYAAKEENDAFLFDITDRRAGEFKSVYLWYCATKDVTARSFPAISSRDAEEEHSRKTTGLPTIHALGNTYFAYSETIGLDACKIWLGTESRN